jgi:hypothetical protein
MRKLILTLAAALTVLTAASLTNRADAMTLGNPAGLRGAIEDVAVIDNVRHRDYRGYRYGGYRYGGYPAYYYGGYYPAYYPAYYPVYVGPRFYIGPRFRHYRRW